MSRAVARLVGGLKHPCRLSICQAREFTCLTMRTLISTSTAAALVAAVLLIFVHSTALAADDSATSLLPTDPSAWLNAPPLTPQMLEGKGVVLWFFEEQCPTCRGKWPGMYELAKK